MYVSLISGGIDSPVASHLLLNEGKKLVFLHMDNRPFGNDEGFSKVKDLVRTISRYHEIKPELYSAPHGKVIQEQIAARCDKHYQCVICRRFMYRIGEALCRKVGARAIITGENLGQVASQTMDNLYVEEEAVSTPVLRPLVGWDKREIVDKAKTIGTFDISIRPGVCCLLAPKRPKTYGRLEKVRREEEKLDVGTLVKEAVKGMKQYDL